MEANAAPCNTEHMSSAAQRQGDVELLRKLGCGPGEERPAGVGSGIAALDALLPGSGVPRGRLSELSGRRCSGKRALALRFCAQVLARGRNAVWVDGSYAARERGQVVGGFYPVPALEHGALLSRLLVVRPPTAVALLKAVDLVLGASGAVELIAVDLPAGALPSAQLSRLPRIARAAERSGTAVLFISDRGAPAASLGTFISLQLWVERSAARATVTIIKSKLGKMAHSAEVAFDGAHSVYLDSTL